MKTTMNTLTFNIEGTPPTTEELEAVREEARTAGQRLCGVWSWPAALFIIAISASLIEGFLWSLATLAVAVPIVAYLGNRCVRRRRLGRKMSNLLQSLDPHKHEEDATIYLRQCEKYPEVAAYHRAVSAMGRAPVLGEVKAASRFAYQQEAMAKREAAEEAKSIRAKELQARLEVVGRPASQTGATDLS